MKIVNVALLGLSALVGYKIFFAVKSFKMLEVAPISFFFNSSTSKALGNSNFTATLGIYNPNSIDLDFSGFMGSLSINGNKITNIDAKESYILRARQTTPVVLNLSIPTTLLIQNLGMLAYNLFVSPVNNIKILLDGTVDAKVLKVPVSIPYVLKFK